MRRLGYVSDRNLDAKAGAWLDRIRRSTAPRPHLVLEPRSAALIVIDMLRYFADPSGRAYLPAASAILPRIQAILAAFRALGGTIVFTRHGHEGPHDLGMLGRFFSDHIAWDEPESEILPALAPLPGEPVLRKKTYDAFLGTELGAILEKKGARQLLITGVLTHMCCETTARSAFCRGFEVYVPVDATASNTEAHHVGSLLGMADSVAVALSTEEVIRRCEKSR